MKRALISILTLSAIIVVLNAQDTAPVPYVASVKKNAGGFGAQMRIAPGMISANGVPVRLLMRQAFGQLQDFQLVGGPPWINSDRFDIEAKIEGGGPIASYHTRQPAEAEARKAARALAPAQVQVHTIDGQIETRWAYSHPQQ